MLGKNRAASTPDVVRDAHWLLQKRSSEFVKSSFPIYWASRQKAAAIGAGFAQGGGGVPRVLVAPVFPVLSG
ncbi:MAG: hypothetical protein JO081_20635 [Alphaproteobacteria bacterium]|nr:hypothetical protein [Alphaproteobacteria bacterium]